MLVRARAGEGGAFDSVPDASVQILRLIPYLTGPRCLCQIFAVAGGAVVLVAGPLLEHAVPPLV